MPRRRFAALLPTLVTLLRVLAVPPILRAMRRGRFRAALLLTAAGSATDFLDGRIARACGTESPTGALLDPVADKVFETSLLIELARVGRIPGFHAALVTLRNLAQLSSIPVLGYLRIPFKVKPRLPAKAATAAGMAAILLAAAAHPCARLPGRAALDTLLRRVVVPASCLLELHVLLTFLPRYLAIARGRHDTFE